MKRIRIIAASVAALVVVVICFVGLNRGGASGGGSETKVPTVSAVVASREIPAYTLLTADMLTVAEVPQGSVPSGAVSYGNVDDVVGSITLSPIVSGETILSNHLRGKDGATVTPTIDENMRAVSVGVTDITGVSNLIRVGNRVDVYFIADDPDNSSQYKSTLLLENITVLALDQRVSDAAAGSATAEDSTTATTTVQYETVTLHVNPEQAARLTAASQKGTIWLSLRNQTDAGGFGEVYSSTFDTL